MWQIRGPITGPLVGAYAGKMGALDVWAGGKNASNRGCLLVASMRGGAGIKKNCQMTYKPGSVPTAEAVDDGYSSRMAVANHLKQPTRTSVQDRTCCTRQRVSLHGLAPDGVYHARPVAGLAVRSYRTFSPLPAVRCRGRRSVFCGTFPGVAPAGRYPAS